MSNRRVIIPGGTYFFTVVTCNRLPILASEETVSLLRSSFSKIMRAHPFRMDACVILPDHLHAIWTLPPGDADYSMRWRLIKSCFTRKLDQLPANVNHSRDRKGEQAVWQRRYWEHLIRNEDDLFRHFDYIHYNPVKHGYVLSPAKWPYSSFKKFVREGLYPPDWGSTLLDIPSADKFGE